MDTLTKEPTTIFLLDALNRDGDMKQVYLIVEKLESAVPFCTKYIEFETEAERNEFLKNPDEEDMNLISRSFYRDGDVLFEEDIEKLEQSKKHIVISDDNGFYKLEDCDWDWMYTHCYWDGSNQRAVCIDSDDVEEFEASEVKELLKGKTKSFGYRILKIKDRIFFETWSFYSGDQGSAIELEFDENGDAFIDEQWYYNKETNTIDQLKIETL